MAEGRLTKFIDQLPVWVVFIAWVIFVGAVITGLIFLFGGAEMERTRIKTEKTVVLRTHYPELAALFAQWDQCNFRPFDPALSPQICDHKMIKDALVIDKTPAMLAFLLERDALYAAVDAGGRE